MNQPVCPYCKNELKDDEVFVDVSGGTVHRDEPQHDAGGGNNFHPKCAIKYIRETYLD